MRQLLQMNITGQRGTGANTENGPYDTHLVSAGVRHPRSHQAASEGLFLHRGRGKGIVWLLHGRHGAKTSCKKYSVGLALVCVRIGLDCVRIGLGCVRIGLGWNGLALDWFGLGFGCSVARFR